MTEDETRPDPALVDVVARAMRADVTEGDDCLPEEREDECFRRHVHLAWSQGDKLMVYAHLERLAELALTALSATGRLLPDGGETREEYGVSLNDDNEEEHRG